MTKIREKYCSIVLKPHETTLAHELVKGWVVNWKTGTLFPREELYEDLLQLFKENPEIDPNKLNRNGDSILHIAVRNKLPDRVIEAICQLPNININSTNWGLETPLHYATQSCNYSATSILVLKEANFMAKDYQGNTPASYIKRYWPEAQENPTSYVQNPAYNITANRLHEALGGLMQK